MKKKTLKTIIMTIVIIIAVVISYNQIRKSDFINLSIVEFELKGDIKFSKSNNTYLDGSVEEKFLLYTDNDTVKLKSLNYGNHNLIENINKVEVSELQLAEKEIILRGDIIENIAILKVISLDENSVILSVGGSTESSKRLMFNLDKLNDFPIYGKNILEYDGKTFLGTYLWKSYLDTDYEFMSSEIRSEFLSTKKTLKIYKNINFKNGQLSSEPNYLIDEEEIIETYGSLEYIQTQYELKFALESENLKEKSKYLSILISTNENWSLETDLENEIQSLVYKLDDEYANLVISITENDILEFNTGISVEKFLEKCKFSLRLKDTETYIHISDMWFQSYENENGIEKLIPMICSGSIMEISKDLEIQNGSFKMLSELSEIYPSRLHIVGHSIDTNLELGPKWVAKLDLEKQFSMPDLENIVSLLVR